ncbi:hypothetical protein SRHO_G00003640 [Serrasalmus rhombeus]
MALLEIACGRRSISYYATGSSALQRMSLRHDWEVQGSIERFLLADNEAARPLPRHECSSEVQPTAGAWPPHLESRQIVAGAGSFLSRSKAEGPDPLNYLLNFQPGLFLLTGRGEP